MSCKHYAAYAAQPTIETPTYCRRRRPVNPLRRLDILPLAACYANSADEVVKFFAVHKSACGSKRGSGAAKRLWITSHIRNGSALGQTRSRGKRFRGARFALVFKVR